VEQKVLRTLKRALSASRHNCGDIVGLKGTTKEVHLHGREFLVDATPV
jgi:hypothetical protein